MVSSVSKKSARQFSEADVWRAFGAGWRPLWAGFRESGFSVEWHDFECKSPLDWAGSFHPDSVEICLNLGGHAEFPPATEAEKLSRRS